MIQSQHDVLDFIKTGGIMPKPQNCDDFFYKLMKKCWKFEASKRIKFQGIVKNLLAKTTVEDREFLAKFQKDSFFFSDQIGIMKTPLNFVLNFRFHPNV